MRATVALWSLAGLFISLAPAYAAPECLANGQSFAIGEAACLSISGKEHLARCEMVLNNTSWTKIQDGCAPRPDAKAEAKPADPNSTEPIEPNAN